MKEGVATLNVRGLQSPGAWRDFLEATVRWTRRKRVRVLAVQEHNLHPDEHGNRVREASMMGWQLFVSYAARGVDGKYWGGALIMVANDIKVHREVANREGLMAVSLNLSDEEYTVASIYAPVNPSKRVDFINDLKNRLPKYTIAGGDWNVVPDVTVDRRGPNALQNANVGAAALAAAADTLKIFDIRREQLGNKFEHTRKDGSSAARLDRWYVPIEGKYADILWSIEVNDEFVYKNKKASDHLAVILTLDKSVGERGRERATINEAIVARPEIQSIIIDAVHEAYSHGGREGKKWARAHNVLRDRLLKETANLSDEEYAVASIYAPVSPSVLTI